jgi:hypothetical protein
LPNEASNARRARQIASPCALVSVFRLKKRFYATANDLPFPAKGGKIPVALVVMAMENLARKCVHAISVITDANFPKITDGDFPLSVLNAMGVPDRIGVPTNHSNQGTPHGQGASYAEGGNPSRTRMEAA